MKILLATTTDMKSLKHFIQKEKESYPFHYFWGFDISELDIQIINPTNSRKRIDKIASRFQIFKLSFQLDILKKAKNYDLVYLNIDAFYTILLFFRFLRVLKTPIIAINHHSFNTKINKQKKLFNLLLTYRKKILYIACDKVVFISRQLLKSAQEHHRVPERHCNSIEWGADVNYFGGRKQKSNNSYLALGGTNRDFDLIVDIFNEINLKLRVFGKLSINKEKYSEIPKNIYVDTKLQTKNRENISPVARYKLIKDEYLECKAVLIPIKKQLDVISGLTVLFEAIACGKPLIVTDNVIFPFDVEIEQVGIKVAYGDKQGWIDAINFFENNPSEVEKMGINAQKLALNKFNYVNYKNDLYKQITHFEKRLNL